MTGSVYRLARIIVFLLLQLWTLGLWAQDAPYFSKEPQQFLEQLETFFSPVNRKELKEQRKAIEENLEMETSSEGNFSLLVDMLNGMTEQKLNAWPYFYNYLLAAQAIMSLENGDSE